MELHSKLTLQKIDAKIMNIAANAANRHGEDGNPLVLET
jgi:hypothetical protein